MKLLFDEHISFRTVRSLLDIFPDSKHLKFFRMEEATDMQIWKFAASEGFAIVTKDDDFRQLSLTHGHPPKVIWLKAGNLKSRDLRGLFKEKSDVINEFVAAEEGSLLILK